jgi:hypothetical protein
MYNVYEGFRRQGTLSSMNYIQNQLVKSCPGLLIESQYAGDQYYSRINTHQECDSG